MAVSVELPLPPETETLLPPEVQHTITFSLSGTVILFGIGLTFATGLLFGLFPALHSTRPDLVSTLKNQAGQPAGAKGAAVCLPLTETDDEIAVIGDNGKTLIFPVAELPEMPRGKGVKLQAYREGGLRDAMAFNAGAGAGWIDAAGRNREWPDWREWLGRRAAAGKLAPKGFPATKRFRPR